MCPHLCVDFVSKLANCALHFAAVSDEWDTKFKDYCDSGPNSLLLETKYGIIDELLNSEKSVSAFVT